MHRNCSRRHAQQSLLARQKLTQKLRPMLMLLLLLPLTSLTVTLLLQKACRLV
jgi:hypothetical protein